MLESHIGDGFMGSYMAARLVLMMGCMGGMVLCRMMATRTMCVAARCVAGKSKGNGWRWLRIAR
jgi:hypothetical protein